MNDLTHPVLYSFRRCPYAMRTRMALSVSGIRCELREVVLRDKPEQMLAASPKATVPVLIEPDGTVRDESLQIMQWALASHDPNQWLQPETGSAAEMMNLIGQFDGPFKEHLDRYKYSNRYADQSHADELDGDVGDTSNNQGLSPEEHRDAAMQILQNLDNQLSQNPFLFGNRLTIADVAIAPFVRQFANTDSAWFSKHAGTHLQQWLSEFVQSELFVSCMLKYPPWKDKGPEDSPDYFPA